LGIANLQTVDPPWMPHAKTLVQQVALNQEEVVCDEKNKKPVCKKNFFSV
jgi:hypothetical protein